MSFQESPFFAQAAFMIECLPEVNSETCFALKGGTAINLFYDEVPRLSVDIDLTYLPEESFEAAQNNISLALERIATRLEKRTSTCKVLRTKWPKSSATIKLVVHLEKLTVVIEPNIVLRGSIELPIERSLTTTAQDLFSREVAIQCLTKKEIFAGKFCAALDRQHPRDLFDVSQFFKFEKYDERQKNLFLVYLLSTGRPIHEILFPTLKDISQIYQREFQAMTESPVPLEKLLSTRDHLISTIHSNLSLQDKDFLKSFSSGTPQWELFAIPGVADFAGVNWKLKNLQVLRDANPKKLDQQLEELTLKLDSA